MTLLLFIAGLVARGETSLTRTALQRRVSKLRTNNLTPAESTDDTYVNQPAGALHRLAGWLARLTKRKKFKRLFLPFLSSFVS